MKTVAILLVVFMAGLYGLLKLFLWRYRVREIKRRGERT